MPTASENILEALVTLLTGALDATVERNSAMPETIPTSGLVIVRDGEPGEPLRTLGPHRNQFYQHTVEIEVYAANGDRTNRDETFNAVIADIGDALESDLTIGGLIFGMTYGQPSALTQPIEGGADIKAATIYLTLDYETSTPLG